MWKRFLIWYYGNTTNPGIPAPSTVTENAVMRCASTSSCNCRPVSVTINVNTGGCCVEPQRPTGPTKPLVFSPGDTYMAIRFPVTIPAAVAGQQVDKANVYWSVDGIDHIEVAPFPMTDGVDGSGAIVVPQGSSGKAWFAYVDKAGNESVTKSPEFVFTNAADTQPPDGPSGALVFGKGDTVDDPSPDPFAPPTPPPVTP